jgi:hypothetical protein
MTFQSLESTSSASRPVAALPAAALLRRGVAEFGLH